MNIDPRRTRPTRFALLALGALLLARAASASTERPEEIVVYGARTELALDTASLRIDLKEHAAAIARSVQKELDEPEQRQAAAAAKSGRG